MSEIMPNIYWKIGLQGNDWGLEQLLLSQVSEENYRLRKEKRGYFLIVPATTKTPARIADLESNFKATRPLLYAQQDEVMEKVERILKVLSSQLWCIDMRLGKLGVKHIGYCDHGEYLRRVSIVEEIRILDHISVTAFDASGQVKHHHPADPLTQLRHDTHSHDRLENLMVLIQDYGTETWVGLYKIFEHVSAAVGGKSKLKSLGVPTQETQRFTHTANHPEASGLLSRHAVTRQKAPKDPMTLAAAQQYIQNLVLAYRQHIRSKTAG